jgi:hypothetical protein
MVRRRAQPWYKEADRQYPIRLKFVVPSSGMQAMENDRTLADWLQAHLGPAMWNWGPADSNACRQTVAYYFRRMEDARRFLAAFPQLQLADGVEAPIDPTPVESVP